MALLLAICLSINGCGYSMFAASTKATYETPDGRRVTYESNKEQVGLKVSYEVNADGSVKAVHLSVDRASAQEQSYAALAKMQDSLAAILEKLAPALAQVGALAAGS